VPQPGRYWLSARKRVALGAWRPPARDVVVDGGQVLRRVDLGKSGA